VIARLVVLSVFALRAGTAAADPASASPASDADRAEPGSAEEIAAATTAPQFLSPWVASLPESATVPSPRRFFGRIMGAPGELVNTAQAHAYARALAAASPRVRTFTIGRSEEGREILMLAIADEAGIRDLERLRAATAALSDPRRTDAAAAARLAAEARPIYYFNAVMHSDETGSTEATLELAYRLAVAESPLIRRIRERTVVLINPVSNPDGRDKVVEWFYRFLKGRTDYDTLPRQSPPYWSRYAFVDINRDAHQQAHAAVRAVHDAFHGWHPQVVHDLHEAVPLLMTWNGTGPYNPNVDPITYAEFQALSFHEVEQMTAFGMPGVATWNFGEGFAHLYTDSVAINHNAIGRGYETFGNGTAETVTRTLEPADTSAEWWRVLPPPSGPFRWSARDNVNYTVTGALAALDYVAQRPRAFLEAYWRKGWNSWRAGVERPPYGFVIPADQGDPARVAALVDRLLRQRIEVHRATAPLVLRDGRWPAGSYVVRLDQPYRNYAVDLLLPQHYPKDAAEPYDDVSWSLPAHFHLDVTATADPAVRDAALEPVLVAPAPAGRVLDAPRPAAGAPSGPPVAAYLLADTGQEGLLAARYRLSSLPVEIAERAFRADGRDYPAGSWIVPAHAGVARVLADVARDLALEFVASPAVPEVARHAAPVPRLCVWVPWADTDTIGWLRYSLDQRRVPYTYLRDEDIRADRMRPRCDVVVYGHVDLELAEQIHGLPKRWSPLPFRKTATTPSHGTPAESDDITGGIGWEGLSRLQRWVEDGGLMVTLGSGSALALEGGLVRGVRRDEGGVPRSTAGGGAAAAAAAQAAATRTPGAHLRVSFARPEHPLAYGYAARTHVFRQNFPLYSVPRRWLRMAYCTTCLDGPPDRDGVVMEWGDPDGAPLVVSGQAWGEANLVGRPAILDLPAGRGRVVAFNFNPVHRDMNRGDQRLLWNAVLNWRAILAASRAPDAPAPQTAEAHPPRAP
jgi:hypothetical protein